MTTVPTTSIRPYALPLLAILVSMFTTAYDLGAYPLLQPDEGRNAGIALEMLRSGAWLVPSYDGLPYLDKPAFYFRAVALSLAVFGENEAAARFASVFFAWALLLLVYRFCQRRYGGGTAAIAVMVIACTPLFIAFARIVIFDMALAFFVSAAIFACFEAAERQGAAGRRFYSLAAACVGGATLVKGPVGFILPTLVIAVHQALERRRGWWREAFTLRNAGILLGLLLPWFVGVSLQHPDFPYYGLVKESLQRFTSNEFHRSSPFYYYGVIIALCFFPWSVLLPESILIAWRERRSWHRADRLFAVWALAVVGFFSLSQSKLPGYILTAIVALGVLVARVFAAAIGGRGPGSRVAMVRHGALGFAAGAAILAALSAIPLLDGAALALLPAKAAPYLRDLRPVFVRLTLSCAAAFAIALLGFLRRDARITFAAFLLFPLLMVAVATRHIDAYAARRSAFDLARALPAVGRETSLVCYLCFPNGLSFYLKRPMYVVSYRDGRELESNYVRFKLEGAAVWPEPMIREHLFREWTEARRQPFYLLSRHRDVDHLRDILGRPDIEFTPLSGEYSGGWVTPRK